MAEMISSVKKSFKHCQHCGAIVPDDDRIKHCKDCQPEMTKETNKKIAARYRERHKEELREKQWKWAAEHPGEKRLIARNSAKKHKEERKIKLAEWRKNNPEKVRLQNKRAKKNIRGRKLKNLYTEGKYKPLKIHVTCPKCEHRWPTMAKRPQCDCGYSFPREYYDQLIDNLPTKPCKCCGREVPFYGRGLPREYCECCLPQINALKRVLSQMRQKQRNPNRFKEWYKETTELLVASTCVVCSAIIPYKGKGLKPYLCEICGPNRELRANKRRDAKRKESNMTIEEFIRREKFRNRIFYKNKKWTSYDIQKEYEKWRGTTNHGSPIVYEDENGDDIFK